MSKFSQPLPTSGHHTLAEPSCLVPPLSSVSLRKNGLGGWQAQASDRYARVSKLRVVQTIQKNDRDDPLGEAETLIHLDEFMAQKVLPPESWSKLNRALEKWEVGAPSLAEVLEQELVAPEDKDIRAATEVDVQEGGHTRTEGIQPIRREVVMHRSRLNACVRTRRRDEQLFAILYSLGTTSACLGKGGSGHCTKWEHATLCQTWITWSMLTLGRPSRPPQTLTLCASSVLRRTSPTRTSRRTHRPHLPRLVKLDEQKAAAQQLDPSLEALLREVNLNEELIMAFRVQEIHDRDTFVALDTSEEGLRKTAEEAFGVDPSKWFVHKRGLAKIVKAWQTAKVQNETKVRVDAVARAHGEPVTMPILTGSHS